MLIAAWCALCRGALLQVHLLSIFTDVTRMRLALPHEQGDHLHISCPLGDAFSSCCWFWRKVVLWHALRRFRGLHKLVFDTMRERMRLLPLPVSIAKALATPREKLYTKARLVLTQLFETPVLVSQAMQSLITRLFTNILSELLCDRRSIAVPCASCYASPARSPGLPSMCMRALPPCRDPPSSECGRMAVRNCDVRYVRGQLPIPWNTLYTVDFINEMTADHVCPEGVLTLQDLGVDPRPVRDCAQGFPWVF